MKCRECEKDKSDNEFFIPKSGYSNHRCKECESIRKQKYYQNNKDPYKERSKSSALKFKQFIEEYKSTRSCIKCGESDPCCLDFHHINPDDKKYKLPSLKRGYSIKTILNEISKCKILCSNCHRKLHANRFII